MDWSTRRVVDLMEMILMSAGTLSPTSVRTDRKGSSYSCRITTLTDRSPSAAPRQDGCVSGYETGRSIDWFERSGWIVLLLKTETSQTDRDLGEIMN